MLKLRFKPLSAAVLGLALSVTIAHAEPPSPDNVPSNTSASPARSDGQSLTVRSLNAVSEAASKMGDVISTGALALGFGVQRATSQASVLLDHAKQALGVRYRWGGATAETGFDCSGFVRAVVQQTVGRLLPHHAADQAAVTQKIGKDEIQPGDLVFFKTIRQRAYSHVGIYMGDGQFIHAPSRGKTVRIDSLSAAYWQKRFEGARRVLTGEPLSADYSLASADTPDTITSQAATSSAVLPDITVSTTHDGPAGNAAATNLAGDVNRAAITAAPETGGALPSSVPQRSGPAAAGHDRRQKQAAIHHGSKRGKPATDSRKQDHRAMVAYAVGQAAASTATGSKKQGTARRSL